MRTIFLDRDGTINVNRADHVRRWEEFEFLPGALTALRLLTEAGFRIFVVTNQAIINRGMSSADEVHRINELMRREVRRHGGQITDIILCPHTPSEHCPCRKPQPGMFSTLLSRWGGEGKGAYMVGDAVSDIIAGQGVGAHGVMVLTGRGREQLRLAEASLFRPLHVATDLLEATQWILQREGCTSQHQREPLHEKPLPLRSVTSS